MTLHVDEPLAMLRSGATSFYNADALTSVTSLSGSTGTTVQTYVYDSFGKQISSSGSLTNPFQYASREFDSEAMQKAASDPALLATDLADYLVPVNADVPEIDVTFLDYPDYHISPIGARGIGEITITGVAPAIANAVYHATGIRVRDLPITIEKLLEAPAEDCSGAL